MLEGRAELTLPKPGGKEPGSQAPAAGPLSLLLVGHMTVVNPEASREVESKAPESGRYEFKSQFRLAWWTLFLSLGR